MGPRPIGRGNIRSTRLADASRNRLQWGRDQLVAEMSPRAALGGTGMLQWGRDQLVAEICCGAGESLMPGLAGFNGAATNWSRKCVQLRRREATQKSSLWLQWGRDQLVAEIREERRFEAMECGRMSFNGAATNWSRKLEREPESGGPQWSMSLQWGRDQLVAEMLPAASQYDRARASMGPRPIGRGNSALRPWTSAVMRFNGAATNWSRKFRERPFEAIGLISAIELQWGRDQLVAEIASAQVSNCQIPASPLARGLPPVPPGQSCLPLYHLTFPPDINTFPARERPHGFLAPPRLSHPHLVTNTGYCPISPSMYRASSRAWISSSRR
jgi:hypothetical protein